MNDLDTLAKLYVEACYYEEWEHVFSERCAALSGFKAGFRAAIEMALDEISRHACFDETDIAHSRYKMMSDFIKGLPGSDMNLRRLIK